MKPFNIIEYALSILPRGSEAEIEDGNLVLTPAYGIHSRRIILILWDQLARRQLQDSIKKIIVNHTYFYPNANKKEESMKTLQELEALAAENPPVQKMDPPTIREANEIFRRIKVEEGEVREQAMVDALRLQTNMDYTAPEREPAKGDSVHIILNAVAAGRNIFPGKKPGDDLPAKNITMEEMVGG